jgi:hypothetical protein
MVDSFNEAYVKNELSMSQRESVLSLIFKKNDREYLTNYRPISLANTDYKILAFTLTNRLQTVLGSIIHSDQSGFIKKTFHRKQYSPNSGCN